MSPGVSYVARVAAMTILNVFYQQTKCEKGFSVGGLEEPWENSQIYVYQAGCDDRSVRARCYLTTIAVPSTTPYRAQQYNTTRRDLDGTTAGVVPESGSVKGQSGTTRVVRIGATASLHHYNHHFARVA